ncbi:hypothetical protein ACFLVX_02010 [Chloroflexota bacterium]
MSMKVDRDKPENQEKKVLTCIHPSYTLSATPEPDSNETESLIVKNFLDTLADISLSIASRNSKKDGES